MSSGYNFDSFGEQLDMALKFIAHHVGELKDQIKIANTEISQL